MPQPVQNVGQPGQRVRIERALDRPAVSMTADDNITHAEPRHGPTK
jgi:hypothetical protein